MSSFHLVVLGTLVVLGGILLLARVRFRTAPSTSPARDRLRHAHTMAGTRWLAVGAIALFFGATRGGEPAYFVGFWEDVFLHVGVVAGCWIATASRADRLGRPADSAS
jgi:hypothetical protein